MNDWLIWQLIDSSFPSGSFAHSGGLEAVWQHGIVSDSDSLVAYLRVNLRQIERGPLVFGRQAWNEPARFASIDAECDLFLNDHVANRASRAQGKAVLSTAAATFESNEIKDLAATVRDKRLAAHLAPIFGFVTHYLGVSEGRFVSMYLFLSIRASLSAAVRLGITGPLEAQRIQAAFGHLPPSPGTPGEGRGDCPAIQNPKSKIANFKSPHPNPLPEYRESGSGPVQTAPLLDLIQAGQDRLYSRLFQS